MIIWSGLGFLVAVIVFGCSLVMEFATESATKDEQFYQNSLWAFPLALLLSAAITFLADVALRSKSLGDNSLFFIPMRWWAPILAVIALATFGYKVVNA
jgi:hypothetical protein